MKRGTLRAVIVFEVHMNPGSDGKDLLSAEILEETKAVKWPKQVRGYVHGTGQCIGLTAGKEAASSSACNAQYCYRTCEVAICFPPL